MLSTIFGIVAIIGKSAVEGDISLFEKGLLGAKALLFYLIKFFLPFRLSILYPHESVISITDPWIFIGLITTLLILITVPLLYCFTSFFHKNKYHSRLLPLGITLFFLMLVPSFGNVMKDGVLYFASDRYMYLPMVGLLVVLAGILMRLITVRSLQQLKTILSACGVIIAILGMMSFNQSLKWRNTGTLFDHVLRSYPQSAMAHINLGAWYRDTGKHEQAIEQYEKALDLDPDRPRVVGLLAQATAENGETFGGLLLYTDAISMDPEDPELHYGLGSVHALRKEYAKAADAFRKTIALDPNASNALHNLGGMEYELGQKEEATKHYLLAFEYDPFSFESLYNAAVILGELGRKSEAIDIYLQLLELKPNHIKAHVNLGLLHLRNNQKSKGIRQLQKALELDPGNQPARKTLKAVGVNR